MLSLKIINLKNKIKLKDISKNYIRLRVFGDFGYIQKYIRKEVCLSVKDDLLVIKSLLSGKKGKNLEETYLKLISNMLYDVSYGFSVSLELRGVGSKVSLDKDSNELVFNLGYSHPIKYTLPNGIITRILDDRGTAFILIGNDREQVSLVAAQIIKLKKKDSYKGKGIFFYNEEFKVKEGKGKSA